MLFKAFRSGIVSMPSSDYTKNESDESRLASSRTSWLDSPPSNIAMISYHLLPKCLKDKVWGYHYPQNKCCRDYQYCFYNCKSGTLLKSTEWD